MHIELKKLKINKQLSEETTCFSAEVWIDGKKAGLASNRGCGGPNEYWFDDRALEQEFYTFCKSLPPLPPDETYDRELAMDEDLYLGQLINRFEVRKQIERWCKKQTVYKLKGDAPDSWRISKTPFSPQTKTAVQAHYGDTLLLIANEDLEAAVTAALERPAQHAQSA